MRADRRRGTASIFACAVAAALAACAGAPPKKDGAPKRTVLMTEYDDAQVGKEASRDVEAEIGLLGDPALDAYVTAIGRKLLRGMPVRAFDYQFRVVDQVEPNAFTLPGGYIFVSRGLLVLANDEDELACVIGHEITHAAHRHAAAQQAVAAGGNPLTLPWVRAARMAAYGRDMERDADQGGQILCAAAGYDPSAMATFMTTLLQWERLRAGTSRAPGFFDTHPGTQERAATNAVRASEIRWRRDESLGDTRAALLRHTDGLAVGERPEAGVFEGDRFLHPGLDFQLRFPPGWIHANTAQVVGASAPSGDAVVFLVGDAAAGAAQAAAEAWVEKAREGQSIEVEESKAVKVGDIDAWRMRLAVSGRGGSLTSFVTFVPYGRTAFRITGAAPSMVASRYLGQTLATARSFAPLSDEDRRSIRSTRLRVVKANRGEDVAGLGRRTGNSWDVETTSVSNGMRADRRFEGGELVKIAREEPYVPPRPGA